MTRQLSVQANGFWRAATLVVLALAVALHAQSGTAPAPGTVQGANQSIQSIGPGATAAQSLPTFGRPQRSRGRAHGTVTVTAASGPSQALAGRVVSGADQHPLPGALIQLSDQRTNREVASTHTDAAGRYSFPPQPAGKYHLRASAPDYHGQLYLEHDGYSASIVLGAGLPTTALDFALLPGASIHGRITDEAGDPP